jgi:hypothetical protein
MAAFVAHLPTFVAQANAVAVAMDLNDTTDTSVSSVLIGLGAKTFTVSAGKSFQPGMYLVVADSAAPSTNSMVVQVTSYSGTSLVVSSKSVRGSGTIASWVISLSAAAADIASDISGATAKATPIDADKFGYWDSVTGLLRSMTWANIKTTLSGVFAALAGSTTQAFSVATATAASHAVRADQNVNDLTSVSATIATGFLTVGLQPGIFRFRNSTLSNGAPNTKFVTAALTLATDNIGASFGLTTAVQGRLYMLAIDDGTATPRLGIINSSGGTSLNEEGVLTSTTAITGAVVSPTTVYTTAALGAGLYPYKVVGAVDITWTSGSGYVTTPALVTGAGGKALAVKNQLVQNLNVTTGAMATGTTLIPADDTIPQITEGDQYMSLAITPTSAASLLEITVVTHSMSNAINNNVTALFRDAVADALAVGYSRHEPAITGDAKSFTHRMLAGTTSEIIFRVRIGGNNAGTTTFNGSAGTATYGGKIASSITIKEYAA